MVLSCVQMSDAFVPETKLFFFFFFAMLFGEIFVKFKNVLSDWINNKKFTKIHC